MDRDHGRDLEFADQSHEVELVPSDFHPGTLGLFREHRWKRISYAETASVDAVHFIDAKVIS